MKLLLDDLQAPLVRSLLAELDDLADIRQAARADAGRRASGRSPATAASIRDGVDPELDELRDISRSGKQRIAEMEDAERARTGIASLEDPLQPGVRVLHRDLEVEPRQRADRLSPKADDRGRRALHHARRSRTTRKKSSALTRRSSSASSRSSRPSRMQVAAAAPRIQDTARALAALDVLSALADAASALNYTKPMVHAGDELIASDARHPVVERHVADAFVPNDVTLDASDHQVVILTGPNMGGKSTYLRQTALLCLMAQAGSFVAARSAKVPIVDRLFARVGASDNLARGQSTFMVEMQETANILHSATSRSLVILDEIGRGTATFDGLSLAWAVAEHLASATAPGPRPSSPRTTTSSPISQTRSRPWQLPCRRARVERRHRLPAQGRAGPLRSQLRHPGRQARRPAAVRRRSRPRDPQRARARRAVARWTTVTERQRRAAAAAWSVPDAGCRGRSRCVRGCARWTSTT